MYFIVVKYDVKPESVEAWPQIVKEFTDSTRAEDGNNFFEWSRSIEEPNVYYLVECFTDEGAGPHVSSDHFAAGLESMRPHLKHTPQIVSRQVDGTGWEPMGELQID
ncbi:antibiotic biosynthesis monooxygenase [Brevibacterium sp. 50QC2O2]|jgi:quinol monooxygenase YgiN|uniref:putative quinol monooxygenase n=1 Tax=Brevibacterium TaxID=1696 RepID=UPI00211C21D0|nr:MULTISPECIES: putative quinol monooxygenase [unclassified Brevibacterium]MCQ9368200.1 antibiotic biosynthesis monooxygenase [Brevibacterium sp. 91QC2O2]MCQ9385539.1 antibiotic biosynthesis monooxygenase [Brevibacterium sp. 68QC2CO]MCQ9389902.1 antibiotic biosynthesis monooxygenase [Brevibacterium sp. 50QC2O2]